VNLNYKLISLKDKDFGLHHLSRSASPYQRSSLTFHIQQVETISPCATTYPWSDPPDSHALTPEMQWIPDSCQS